MITTRCPLLGLTLLLGCGSAVAAAPVATVMPDDIALTVYSSALPGAIPPEFYRPLPGVPVPTASSLPGYAVVRQERTLRLEAGRSQVRFTDVAALIAPTTVSFTSLTDAATRVLEQNFQFDLVSTDKLLQRYIDRPVTVERGAASTVAGTLLSAVDGLVIRATDGGITAVRDYASLRVAELPGGLITRPTLLWEVNATRAGEQRTRVTYQTGGMTWWTDYNLTYTAGSDANHGTVDLAAWVSLINQSGATFTDARLKLVAGDVHRAATPAVPRLMTMAAAPQMVQEDTGFTEQSFDEFHLYTLGRRTTLPANSTKQLELFDQTRRIPAQRLFVYAPTAGLYGGPAPLLEREQGARMAARVDSFLVLRNDKASGLGVPLPAGRIRVSRLDAADGALEFIGEDVISHTPKDETVKVKLGSAFDVVGQRRQVGYTQDTKARWLEEEIEIELRNHKTEAIEVQVRESLFRSNAATLVSATVAPQRPDARTLVFPVKVAADGQTKLRYKVKYTW